MLDEPVDVVSDQLVDVVSVEKEEGSSDDVFENETIEMNDEENNFASPTTSEIGMKVEKMMLWVGHLDVRNARHLLFLLAIHLCLCLPLLRPIYGTDPDSWRLAISALGLHETGSYNVSRFPGYPVVEFALSFIIVGGWNVTNGMSILLGFAGLIALNRILHDQDSPHPGLITLIVALCPMWAIASTTTMDYIWSLTFLLWAIQSISQRPALSGMLLSLSIGSRITSVIALPYFILQIIRNDDSKGFGGVFCVGFVITTSFWLGMLYQRYGFGFFTFYPSDNWVFTLATTNLIAAFGRFFFIAELILFIILFDMQNEDERKFTSRIKDWFNDDLDSVVLFSVGMGFFVLFLYMPHETLYILPIIPLFAIAARGFWSHKVLISTIVIIFASAILPVDYNQSPLLVEVEKREEVHDFYQEIIQHPFDENDVLIAYYLSPALEHHRELGLTDSWHDNFTILYLPNEETVLELKESGKRIFYLDVTTNSLGFNPEEHGILRIDT